ncbi:Uncharacterised protein [Mycobacterium tuberculosis]|uniref:Uncharacterized protein n=1 Tax=Mycobacterium tuberculosis TaxID=1773 RepID=A0A654U0E0_MYCTX|nr:Uncharacterised protein [Mycobacterium tuberculosis]
MLLPPYRITVSSLAMPRSDSSLENCWASTKSRLTGSCRSVRQSNLIAPAIWSRSYALVSSSTSTKTTFGACRLLSAQSAETRTSQRAMAGILSHSSVTSVVNWLGGTGSVTA